MESLWEASSFAIPIGLALAGGIVGLLASAYNDKIGFFWPYSLMLLGMNANKTEDALSERTVAFVCSDLLFFALFLGMMILILRKKDVQA